MDEADRELLEAMVVMFNKNRCENWIDLHNVRIIKFGPRLHLDAHLTVPWYLNVHEAHVEIDELAGLVRKEFGETLELFGQTLLFFAPGRFFSERKPVTAGGWRAE
jgi:divalent metal cation (Fe/Co/Zn/Cd) transporter